MEDRKPWCIFCTIATLSGCFASFSFENITSANVRRSPVLAGRRVSSVWMSPESNCWVTHKILRTRRRHDVQTSLEHCQHHSCLPCLPRPRSPPTWRRLSVIGAAVLQQYLHPRLRLHPDRPGHPVLPADHAQARISFAMSWGRGSAREHLSAT